MGIQTLVYVTSFLHMSVLIFILHPGGHVFSPGLLGLIPLF